MSATAGRGPSSSAAIHGQRLVTGRCMGEVDRLRCIAYKATLKQSRQAVCVLLVVEAGMQSLTSRNNAVFLRGMAKAPRPRSNTTPLASYLIVNISVHANPAPHISNGGDNKFVSHVARASGRSPFGQDSGPAAPLNLVQRTPLLDASPRFCGTFVPGCRQGPPSVPTCRPSA